MLASQRRSQPKIVRGGNILTLGEQRYLVWDTASQSLKRLHVLKNFGAFPPGPPWLDLCCEHR